MDELNKARTYFPKNIAFSFLFLVVKKMGQLVVVQKDELQYISQFRYIMD